MPIPTTVHTTVAQVLEELRGLVAPAELTVYIPSCREGSDCLTPCGDDRWQRLLEEPDRPATSWLVRVEPGTNGLSVSLLYLAPSWHRLYIASVLGCSTKAAWHLARVIS